MKPSIMNRLNLSDLIDRGCSPETSIVLRYHNVLTMGMAEDERQTYNRWLEKTSIREGARIFPLLTYKGVEIYLLDETSLMFTKTIKSIDGCVTIARCKLNGYERVVFESGGNTGTALTEYGQRSGLETFLFVPEENLSLLNSKTFEPERAHLLSDREPGLVKKAARVFEESKALPHIPQTDWRYEASMYRGMFILEEMMNNVSFDWISQTISAAFGPIGIYRVLNNFGHELKSFPRFLGVQQEDNCPMYRAWRSKERRVEPVEVNSTKRLLTRVMYDFKPHTYGAYEDLTELLNTFNGDLATINLSEFDRCLDERFDGKGVLELLEENGIEITVHGGEIVEKTGLIALAGTLKEIDSGKIVKGERVLCALTSGISDADGKAAPEQRIATLDDLKGVVEGEGDRS